VTGRPTGTGRTPDRTAVSSATGLNLRRLRKARGLSLIEVAAAATTAGYPMPPATVARIETGRTSSGARQAVTVDQLVALAAAIGAQPADLLVPCVCEACGGHLRTGFTCHTCGRRGEA